MENIRNLRKGKDIVVKWPLYRREAGERVPYTINPANAKLRVMSPWGEVPVNEVKFNDNVVEWTFRGSEQVYVGYYTLIFVENDGQPGMVTVDTCKAFALVDHSCEETPDVGGDVVTEAVMLEGDVAFAPVVIEVGSAYDDTELREMIVEQDTKLTELSVEVGEINGIFKGQGLTRSGSLISDASLAVTPFIPYTQGENILWQFSNETTSVSSSNINIILYDADLNVLDYFGAGISYNRTIPASSVASATAFIRAAIVPNTGAFIQIGGEVAWDEKRTIRNELETKLSGKLVCVGKNQYDERIVEDGYINVSQTQGSKPSYQSNVAAGYGHSSPIPVISGMTYVISASSYCGGFYVLLLDSEERVVSLLTTDVKDKAITMPNDAAYLVMTTRFGNVDCVNLQVEIGTNATAYEAYRDELSLPIESLPTYIQEAARVAFELKAAQGQEKVYASAGDSLTQGTGAAVGAIDTSDEYYPLSGTAQKTYAYMIAKRNNMAWRNYGISGSTMGNITFNGQSHAPFCVDRYANMADNIDVISLWFGVNDSYYGKLAKAEEWLVKTYGKKMYYPLSASQQGTTAADGTPYATNEQYMACITAEDEFNGVNYKGFALYEKQYIGLPTDTDDTTWWGAWNKVLPYLIEKYPFAKIVIITGYGTEYYLYESVKAIAEKYGVLHLDLREYGVTWLEDDSQTTINYDAADFTDRTYFKEYASGMVSVNEFRKRTMLYDGLHFNKYGYEYITPFVEKALNL